MPIHCDERSLAGGFQGRVFVYRNLFPFILPGPYAQPHR